MIFDHHFVAVVDGTIVNEAVWDMYVEFCNDGDIKVPCLFLGNTTRLQLPENGNVYCVASNDGGETKDIVTTIKKIKSDFLTLT